MFVAIAKQLKTHAPRVAQSKSLRLACKAITLLASWSCCKPIDLITTCADAYSAASVMRIPLRKVPAHLRFQIQTYLPQFLSVGGEHCFQSRSTKKW